jgi:hypothetical protein
MQYGQQATARLPGPEKGKTALDTSYTCNPEKNTVAVDRIPQTRTHQLRSPPRILARTTVTPASMSRKRKRSARGKRRRS